MLTLINQVPKKNMDISVWDKTFEHVGIKEIRSSDSQSDGETCIFTAYAGVLLGPIRDMIQIFICQRSTQNRIHPWLLRGKKRPKEPFPSRSLQLTAPTWEGRFEHPSYFSAIAPLCPPTNPHSWSSHAIALAQEQPLNCLQATSRWGITDQLLLLLHLIYVSINERYMKDVWQCLTFLFPASLKTPYDTVLFRYGLS